MHLISQDLLLKPPVGLPPVMSPSLWILTLLLFIHLPAAPLVGASAPFLPPRRLLSNETAAGVTSAAPTTPPPPDLCSTSTTCNSRIFPHSRTLTIAVVAIFVACVVMAFVSVYARRFCIHEGNLGTNYYSMEMCGGYAGNDALVKSLPVVKYEAGEDESKKMMKECAVCLSEFERGEMLRLLPACEHLFHKDCIDMWLFSHTTCPICRVSLLKHRRGSQSSGAPHQISEAVDLQPILSSHHAPLVTTAAG